MYHCKKLKLLQCFMLPIEHLFWAGWEQCLCAIAVVLSADLASGLVHWAIDTYARVETPFIGSLLARANAEHHLRPRAFVKRTWWQSSWDLVLVSLLFVIVCWWGEALTWRHVLFAGLLANANQIHKWTHRTADENGALITLLQRARLVQTRSHHARHHLGTTHTHYCVLTNFVNPVLDALRFWQRLQSLVRFVSGLMPAERT